MEIKYPIVLNTPQEVDSFVIGYLYPRVSFALPKQEPIVQRLDNLFLKYVEKASYQPNTVYLGKKECTLLLAFCIKNVNLFPVGVEITKDISELCEGGAFIFCGLTVYPVNLDSHMTVTYV